MEQQQGQLGQEESLYLAAAVAQAVLNGDQEGAEAVARLASDPAAAREALGRGRRGGGSAQGRMSFKNFRVPPSPFRRKK